MSEVYYSPFDTSKTYEDFKYNPLYDLLYDLEEVELPYLKSNTSISKCPAAKVFKNHTFVIRSPIDIKICFTTKENIAQTNVPLESGLIEFAKEPYDKINIVYFQLNIHYLFWSNSKSAQLWVHDVPEYYRKSYNNSYIVNGMIPIGKYPRKTNIAIVMKEGETFFEVKRGDPLMAVTLMDNHSLKLIKKVPPKNIIQQAHRNVRIKNFCPYTFSKKLFEKWI